MRIALVGHPIKIKNAQLAIEEKKDITDIVLFSLPTANMDEDIPKFIELEKDADAILFCGIYDYTLFSKYIQADKARRYIKNDEKSLLITFLKLRLQEIPLEKISVDGYSYDEIKQVCLELDLNVDTILDGCYYKFESDEDTNVVLNKIFNFHYIQHINKKTKMCITCMSPVYEKLKESGLPCILVKNSYSDIKREYEALKYEYLLKKKKISDVCAIELEVVNELQENLISDELGIIKENSVIMEKIYQLAWKLDASIDMIKPNHYIILVEREIIEKNTEMYHDFKIFSELKGIINSRMGIGIGFGKNLRDIRNHAKIALKKAMEHKNSCVFMVYDDLIVSGPVDLRFDRSETMEFESYCNRLARETELSTNTIYKLIKIYMQNKAKVFTVSELASLCGVSDKTMYRMISKLECKGYVLEAGYKICNDAGRPSRCIMLSFFEL